MPMARRPPPGPSQKPARDGTAASPFTPLAALRRQLVEQGATKNTSRPKSPAIRSENPSPPGDEDAGLLRAAMAGVRALPTTQQRAELARPAPPPRPRPRHPEPDEPLPSRVRATARPRTDAELFRLEMQGVAPLRQDDRAELGTDRHTRRLHASTAPEDFAGELELPRTPPHTNDPADLFRYAVRGTQPLDQRDRIALERPAPPPHPIKRSEDEREALRESLDNAPTLEDRLEMGDEASFLRPGLPRRVLTDLRRGRWVLQGELDLHGLNRDEAREALAQFIAAGLQQGRRCVRVIHGKGHGSPGKESILKQLSRGWLAQREDILAFCQAAPYDGGSGALLVLLRTAGRPHG